MTTTTILIVDDNRPLAENLAEIFEDEGMSALIATSAQEAIEIVASSKVDLVITDLVMPEASGVTVVEYVRTNHPKIPVLVMTAYAGDSMRTQAEEAGALEVFDKPIDMMSIVSTVERLAGATGNVLVIDDDRSTRLNLAELLLNETSLIPHHVGSIEDARALIKEQEFTAVITDYRLPDGDGLDLAIEIMRESATGILVLITGYFDDAQPFLQQLMTDRRVTIIRKPFNPQTMVDLIQGKHS